MSEKKKNFRKILTWAVLLGALGFGLEHLPGRYTLDDFEDDYEPASPEGIALLALSEVRLEARLGFDRETRHRISRHAEIVVPAGATLEVRASMVPEMEDGEVIARPRTLDLVSDKELTFIYRFVTVASARTLRINPQDPEARVQAVGRYRVLSALATAYRYRRQKTLRRDYKLPDWAELGFQAGILPEHEIRTEEGYSLFTGSQPGKLRISQAEWREGRWQAGTAEVSLPFSDLDPLMEQLLRDVMPDPIALGDLVDLRIDKIHQLTFRENFLDLHVKGRVSYAKSQTVTDVFQPSFTSHLGIAFELPEQVPLEEAVGAVELRNIYSLDFNRSNPIFDRMLRNLARKYREDARAEFRVKNEFPRISEFPGTFVIDQLLIQGDENGFPQLRARFKLLP
ncbi:MAG: hypothetical protein ACO3N7_00405 [Kiritimatiellia bacterium]